MLHKVSIVGITMDPTSNSPIIILKSDTDERSVPIWIGLLEATAIASALKNIQFERPMTHDLFKNFMHQMHAEIIKVEVCDIRDNTFYASIHFLTPEGSFSMDARPSDAIAIALRVKAPIYVEDKVLSQKVAAAGDAEAMDQSQEGQKWADYLEKLSPDDFGEV